MKRLVIAITLTALPFAANAKPAFQPPTATELYNLRADCDRLAKKQLDRDSSNREHEVYSRYDPATDHCYVETDDFGQDILGTIIRFLIDGQTGAPLAMSLSEHHKGVTGAIFDSHRRIQSVGYEAANNFINKIMGDDREAWQ